MYKTFKLFNENILGNIQRLNPNRKINDIKFQKLIDDIFNDYKKYPDLKKVNIIDNDIKKSISLKNIEFGKNYSLSYVFGKFHPILRNIHSGNVESGDRRIKISSIPLSITLIKNDLEKSFNTKRINKGEVRITDTKIQNNYNRNPNINNYGQFITKEDEYYISNDMANYIFKFFIEEFKNKYPELNKSIYKGNMSINDIDKGINPTIKYIIVKNKDGDNLTVQIRKNDNIKNIIKIVKNMTKLEYDEYSKEKTQKLYKLSDEIEKNEKLKIEKKINDLFKKYNINLLPTEWEKFGFRLIGNINYDFIIEFRYKNDISNIINKLIENEIDFDYNIKFEGVKNGFRTDSYKYYRIKFIKK